MDQPSLRTESLFKLTWPVFLQNMTFSLVVLVDFWFYSQLSDVTAGVIGQLIPAVCIGAFVIPVFAGTGVSVASQFMGAKQFHKVVPAYMMNLAFTTTMGCGFAVLLAWLAPDIGRWMGMSEELNAIGSVYLTNMTGYFVFMGVLVAYNAVLSSRGMTHWLMYSSFMVGGINFVLDALFVFGFGWGVRGVVWASIIGAAAATALSVWLVHGRLKVRFYLRGAWRDMRGVLRPMLRIGVANAFEPFSYSTQQVFISTLIISLGVTAMAANNYAMRPHMFQITFGAALGIGGQILMAHWMGARRFDDVHRVFWRALRIATVVAFAYSCVLWVFAERVLSIFTSDPAILKLGGTVLLVSVFMEPARAVNIIGGAALRTVGDARFPLIIAVMFIWGILPVVFFLNHAWGLGLVGLWMCFAADEIIRAGIILWRWQTGRWRSMGLVEPPPAAGNAPVVIERTAPEPAASAG